MRIVGEIPHSNYKITVFHMNNKHSIQFEDGENTQLYKVPDLPYLKNMNDIKQLVDGAFLNDIDKIFMLMTEAKAKTVQQAVERTVEDEFDNII
jgi:hypothetical protein